MTYTIEGERIRFSPPVELATGNSLGMILVSWLGGRSVEEFVAEKRAAAEREIAKSEAYLQKKLEAKTQDYSYWVLDGELYSISPNGTATVAIGHGGRETEVEAAVKEKSRRERADRIASYDGGYFGDDDGMRKK